MSIYDILMLSVMFAAIAFGAWKGLAWQIASFASIVVSYFVALSFSGKLAELLQIQPPWNRLVAMLILFLATSLVIWTIFSRLKGTIKNWNLGAFDRQAGALLGAFKGAILCMVVTMFGVSLFGETASEAICESRTGGYIVKGIDQFAAIVPAEFHEIIKPRLDAFHETIAHENHGHENGGVPLQSQVYGGANDNSGSFEVPGDFDPNQTTQNFQPFAGQWQNPPANGNQNAGQEFNSLIGDVLDNVFDSAKETFKESTQDTANRFWNKNSNR